jgi:hypothetical protein
MKAIAKDKKVNIPVTILVWFSQFKVKMGKITGAEQP